MDVDRAADPLAAQAAREARESDVQRLLRAWQDERHAPDVLPARDALLGRVLDALRRQTDDVHKLRTAAAHLSEEDHYMTMLVQTEVERVKFVVRSYVRTRLFKIEQHAAHITSQPAVQARLTEAELRHAQRYAALVVAQFRRTVLDPLPATQQALDDEVPTMPRMSASPDRDRPVFFRAFADIERLALADGTTETVPRDAVFLMPYRVVEQHLLRGEVELV
ncbi:GINS complex, Sld5 component [Phellopilus nigrolimitatus]|nr:GINS complex, Sld5 component [Phellopilus nigrolimitatus]